MPVAPYQIHRQRQKLDLSRCRSFDNNLCEESSRNQSPVISHNQSYNHRPLPIPFTPIPMATPPENIAGSPTGILKSSPSYRENSFASKLEDFSDNESNYSNLSNSNLKQPNNVHKIGGNSKSTFHFPFKSERSKTVTEGYNLSNNSPSYNNDCSSSTSSAQNSSTTSNSNHKRQNSFLQKKISKLIQTTRSSVSDWKRKQASRHEQTQRYESPGRGSKERREHDSRYKSADILIEEDEYPTTTRGVSSSRVKSSSFDNILSTINSKYFTIPRKSKNIDINEALVVKIMHEQQKTKEEAEQLVKLQRLESLEIDRPVFTYSIYKLNSIGRRQSKKQTLHLDLDQEIFFIIGRGCVEIEIGLSEIESIERSSFNHSSSDHCFSIETSNNDLPLILEAESAETREEIICRVKSFMAQKFGTEETFSGILEKKSKSLNIWSKKEVRIEGSKLYYRSLISQKQYYKRTIDVTTGKAVVTSNAASCQIRINDGFSTYIFREPNLNSVVFNNWVTKISAAQSSALHDSGRHKERDLQPEGLFERIFGEIYAIQKDAKSSNYHLSRMEDYLKQLQQNMSEQRRGSNASSKSGSVVLLASNHLQLQQSPSYGSSLGAASSHKEESSIDNSPFINSDNNSLHKSSQDTSVISSSGNEKQDSTKSENEANNRSSNIYLELESVTYCPEETCETYLKPVEKLILETETNLGRKSDASATFPSPPEPYQNTENQNISQTSNQTPEVFDAKRYSGSFDNDPGSEYTTLEAEKDCLAESLEDHRIDYQKQVSEPDDLKPDSDSRPQSVYDNLTTEPSDEEAKSQPRSDYENMSESESQSKQSKSEITSQTVQGDAIEKHDYVIESDKHYDEQAVNIIAEEPDENHYVILEDTDDDKGNESPYCNDEPQPEPKIRHASEKSSDNLTIENSSEQRSTPETLEAFTSESETSGPTNPNTSGSQKPDNFGQELPPPKPQGNRLSSSPCNFPSPPSPLRVEAKPQTPVIVKQPPTPVFQEPSTPGTQQSASGPQPPSPVVIAGPPKPPPPPPIPPPVFGSAPPPPPPPAPGKLTTRKSILGSKKGPNLKPIHWKGISGHDRLESSLWKSSIAAQNVKINEDQLKKLEAMFKVESSANKKRAVRSLGQKAVYNLDQNRARNLELFLKRKEFDLDENLLNMYFSLTDVESQTHFLQQIRDFQPSDADLKHFSNLADAELADLPAVHKNMAVICRIPNFNLKLDILHSVTEIRDQCLQVENNIQAALNMCKRLQNCENLHLLLQFCLSVGNHLNEGARKPKIEAFSIMDSLPRFLDVRSSTSDYTLLNYIVELIISENPEILNVTDEIDMRQVDFLIGDLSPKPPKSGKRDGFYMLKAPVDFLSKSSAKAQESVIKIKEMQFAAKLDLPNENCPEKYFVEQVQKLLQLDCVFQIIKCKDLLNELEKSYHNLLTLLAEDKSTDPAQLFSILNNFIQSISQIKSQMKADSSPKMPSHKNSSNSYKDAAFLSELTEATKKLK